MQEIFLGSTQNLTVPASATNVLIVHEWGNVTVSFDAVTGGGTYNWTPESVGSHTIYFVNALTQTTITSPPNPVYLNTPQIRVIGSNMTVVQTFMSPAYDYVTDVTTETATSSSLEGTVSTATVVAPATYYKVSLPLVLETDFSAQYASYDMTQFAAKERKIRNLVENYTQQSFGPYLNKTVMVQGTGGNSLPLYNPIRFMNSLMNQYGTDLTTEVTISTESPYFLDHVSYLVWADTASIDYGYVERRKDIRTRLNDFFDEKMRFFITGDFGYYYVPDDVSQAATLLIADDYSGVNAMRLQGIKEAQLGDYSYQLESIDGTTGNIYADNLLSSYVNWHIGLA